MRRTLVSALMLSSMLLPAAANARPRTDDASASTQRVSTGITPPRLINSLVLNNSDALSAAQLPMNSMFEVSFTVDASGQPRDIHILMGQTSVWNTRVTNAVRNLHYIPASIDHQNVPMVVMLNVNLTH